MLGSGISPSLGGGQSVLSKAVNQAKTILPLTTSFIASKGSNLTLTRADATSCATVVDFEGLVKVCKANEIRETGARRVENLLHNTELLSSGWSLQAGATVTQISGAEWEIDLTACTSGIGVYNFSTLIPANDTGVISCTIRAADGNSGTLRIDEPIGTDGTFSTNSPTVTLTNSFIRYSFSGTNTATARVRGIWFRKGTCNIIRVKFPQVEDVSGQSNQAPAEYVPSTENSTGALGVKYFATTNGNTVSGNIVTEATGTPLTTLKGVLTEPSRTNLVWPCGYGVAGVTQTTAALTAASYTLSFKGTGSVTGTGGWVGTLNGTGANNTVSMTVTATAAAATLTVTGSITEMQLELGANNSSVIPTTTAAVTRAVDAASIPASGNITAAAGTMYVEWTPQSILTGDNYIASTTVDASNYTALIYNSTGSLIVRKRIAGVNSDATYAVTATVGTTYKIAGSWGAAGVLASVSGVSGTLNANTTNAQIGSTLVIGQNAGERENTKNLRTWTTQLSQSALNSLTR